MKRIFFFLMLLFPFLGKTQEQQYFPDSTAGIAQRLEDWQGKI